MSAPALTLIELPGRYAVHRFPPEAPLPKLPDSPHFLSVLRSATELSLICDAGLDLPSEASETGFRAVAVAGTLDFSLVGILAGLTSCLAEAGLSVLAISSFDTDFLLVRAADWETAQDAWRAAGYAILAPS